MTYVPKAPGPDHCEQCACYRPIACLVRAPDEFRFGRCSLRLDDLTSPLGWCRSWKQRQEPRLFEHYHVVEKLTKLGFPGEERRRWLFEPHPLFNGRSASEMIYSGHADEVLRALDSLDECTFT